MCLIGFFVKRILLKAKHRETKFLIRLKCQKQVKRTSLWNKACDELKRHQEFLSKVKNIPDFTKEPFGNPFESDDLKSMFNGISFDSGNQDEDVEDDNATFEDLESDEVP